ncbi:inositol polyphosphate 1-phosphatase [Maniola jurtina]|uniref:inositol polyphosphate 1-phosphatase n=1 Tax=Maniola jurtina TaxID=191418 RepID=UPI001E689307|nr:inositol polyphosphate 1-phosphatase [Maniola jurtina]
MADILKVLVQASEKAARIARSCCENSSAETLLVAEKCGTEANTRFDKDFKTVADVLAQECAKAVIISQFPELNGHVRGEECPEIGGVTIGLQGTIESTARLLSGALPLITARRMAEAAHSDIFDNLPSLPVDLPFIDTSDIGVWIDPIDATAEFISGVRGDAKPGHGLPCVTVLIGAYLRSTGEPVIGVINQPFYNNGKGHIVWGLHYGKFNLSSEDIQNSEDKVVLMSGAEKPEIMEKFKAAGWVVKSLPGAGHKLMKVALGEASAYIVSQGTTYRWDTCAPHAIVLARGGNVLCYKNHEPITYNDGKDLQTKEYCNKDGVIAYINEAVLHEIKSILHKLS